MVYTKHGEKTSGALAKKTIRQREMELSSITFDKE
jgi:hypothetical protein